jgi:hypothetical protein
MRDGIALNRDEIAVKPDERVGKWLDCFAIPDAPAMIRDGLARNQQAIVVMWEPSVAMRDGRDIPRTCLTYLGAVDTLEPVQGVRGQACQGGRGGRQYVRPGSDHTSNDAPSWAHALPT